MTAALPYLDEQTRIAEWMDDGQSLTTDDRIPPELAAKILTTGAALAETEIETDGHQWELGHLLDEANDEWTGPQEEFWEACQKILRHVSRGRAMFAANTLRYFVRTVRGCAGLIDRDRYQAVLKFAFFAAAVSMANDDRYVCNNVQAPLEWAVVQTVSGNSPTVEQMKAAFLRDEHKPDAWKTFTANFSLAMKSFDYLPPNLQADIREAVQTIKSAIERLERPTP